MSNKPKEVNPRKSGFEWPLHWQQVTVWMFTCAVLLTQGAISLMQECLPGWILVLAALVTVLIFITVFVYNYKATTANSEDPAIAIQIEYLASQTYFDPCGMAVEGSDLHLWCQICDTFVNESSKHCSSCNRCSYGFDHHCNWLNTCVGGKNYRDFYQLIWIYSFYLAWFGVVAGFGLLEGSI
jgi:hypothetical protein